MSEYVLNEVLNNKTIVEYLAEQGIYPDKQNGDKFFYKCPIHEGDNDPSFVVYPIGYNGRAYQTYYCFGCKSGISIINLISAMEGISPKQAFAKIANGLDIDVEDVLVQNAKELSKIINMSSETKKEDVNERDVLFLTIVLEIREHLKYLNWDNDEKMFFEENVFPKIESYARRGMVDMMEEVRKFLREEGFPDRVKKFVKKEDDKYFGVLK